MKYIDYLFYSYFCYFERRNKRHPKIFWGDSRLDAITIIYTTLAIPMGAILGLIGIFVTPLPELPKLWFGRYSGIPGILLAIPTLIPMVHRYYYNKKITKGNFKIFRDKWGEDPRHIRKGRIAVIIYTVCTIVLPLLGPVILHFIYYF